MGAFLKSFGQRAFKNNFNRDIKMKKSLIKIKYNIYHYDNGKLVEGCPSGLSGDLSVCEISDEDRKNGINIGDLVDDDL